MSKVLDFFDSFESTEVDGLKTVELTQPLYNFLDQEFKITSPCRIFSKCQSKLKLMRIIVICSNVEFDGLQIEGSIVIRTVDNIKISNCEFTKGSTGSGGSIVLTSSNEVLIENCTIHDSKPCGIFIETYSNNVVIKNVKTWKIQSQSVYISFVCSAEIIDCEFADSDETALCCMNESSLNLVNTTIRDIKALGINLHTSKIEINKLNLVNIGQNGINVYQCEQLTHIHDSHFQNTGSSAISVVHQIMPFQVEKNVFEDIHGNAVIMTDNSEGFITDNIIKDIEFPAVAVLQKSTAHISGNTITECAKAGICARYAQAVIIENNKIVNVNDTGISISDSTAIEIRDNQIQNCIVAGVESYNESQVSATKNKFDKPGKYAFMCYAGAFLQASENIVNQPSESMALVSTHGSGNFVNNEVIDCPQQYSGETTGVIFMENNGKFPSITNDKERANDKIQYIEQYQDPNFGMCLKCHKKPRSGFLVPCGHKIFCEECGKEAVEKQDSCPLCRFPIQSFTSAYTSTWEDTNLCTICMENEADAVVLPCGHTGLCSNCVSSWLADNNTCPICRKENAFMKKIHSNF